MDGQVPRPEGERGEEGGGTRPESHLRPRWQEALQQGTQTSPQGPPGRRARRRVRKDRRQGLRRGGPIRLLPNGRQRERSPVAEPAGHKHPVLQHQRRREDIVQGRGVQRGAREAVRFGGAQREGQIDVAEDDRVGGFEIAPPHRFPVRGAGGRGGQHPGGRRRVEGRQEAMGFVGGGEGPDGGHGRGGRKSQEDQEAAGRVRGARGHRGRFRRGQGPKDPVRVGIQRRDADPADQEVQRRVEDAHIPGEGPVHRAHAADAGRTDQPLGFERGDLVGRLPDQVEEDVARGVA
mmetsp:Transcript_6432/g.13390  ORF Transcript_6432/g.13390 Transcript_6432/m.13390 type:complete len:292 (+) Transcript_6432:368-1243(+)